MVAMYLSSHLDREPLLGQRGQIQLLGMLQPKLLPLVVLPLYLWSSLLFFMP
uniref:Uncharacterized protein n=1 Tax=Picea glauca TaxID=3330 RepID=A0A124GNN0_PICGL|nr:hypothetical protein ABT39_MTgene3875 [Picea glauca]QHR90883.1 hypothetical protein Q903MT_gene4910 [Picea sitchensis]